MRRYCYSNIYRFLFLLCSALVLQLQIVWAAPDFDLNLKDLKKPSIPTTVTKKKTVVVHKKKKTESKTTQQKKPAEAEPVPAVAVKHTTTSPTVQKDTEPSELTLHQGGNACQLAERVAVAVARTVPTSSLLNGLDLKPVAAVSYGELGLMIICGMSPAEAYTYSRLLEEHQVELVNIRGDETAEQTARMVFDALALPYQIESANKAHHDSLTYFIPASQEHQRPLRLTLQP
jgi:hypothetical protein